MLRQDIGQHVGPYAVIQWLDLQHVRENPFCLRVFAQLLCDRMAPVWNVCVLRREDGLARRPQHTIATRNNSQRWSNWSPLAGLTVLLVCLGKLDHLDGSGGFGGGYRSKPILRLTLAQVRTGRCSGVLRFQSFCQCLEATATLSYKAGGVNHQTAFFFTGKRLPLFREIGVVPGMQPQFVCLAEATCGVGNHSGRR